MRLLKRYSKGTQLFTTPTKCGNRAAMPGAHWPVYVYTDVPVDVMDQTVERTPLHALHNCTLHTTDAVPGEQPLSTDKHLTMLFEGGTTKQGLSFIILMDTGASANFISPQLLRRLQVECQPADAKLRLADDTEAPILGKVQLRLKIQQFSTVVWCYVTDLCKEFDVILGNTFMTEHNAVLNYPRLTVSLTRHGKRFTLKAGRKTEFATESKLFLNCAQARRSLKNGCEAFLVMVNALLNETDTDASSDVTCAADVTNTDTENSLADGITSLRH